MRKKCSIVDDFWGNLKLVVFENQKVHFMGLNWSVKLMVFNPLYWINQSSYTPMEWNQIINDNLFFLLIMINFYIMKIFSLNKEKS